MADSNSLKTMQLNDQKAGMKGVDKEAINKVIYEASKGTPYFISQEKKQERIDFKVKEMLLELQKFTSAQRKEALEKMDALCATMEAKRNLSQSLVHIDMDAFYAAVEMRDSPELLSKPMAVGSSSMLATSNYEARKYGVRAAMPGFIAKKLCPTLVIVPPNFDKYKKVSKQVMNIIKEYDPNYSAASLDEVYFNLTDYIAKLHRKEKHFTSCEGELSTSQASDQSDNGDSDQRQNVKYMNCATCDWSMPDSVRDNYAWDIVQTIRKQIFDVTQLTASAGIAPNTMLSKVCSDENKPNGQFQIHSVIEEVGDFVKKLPVKKVSGIGPVQSQILNGLGIFTCVDLYTKRDIVALLFSPSSTQFYMRVALGLGSTTIHNDYIRKSIGNEVTFKDTSDPKDLHVKCEDLCNEAVEDLKSHHLVAKVVVLKIKTVNFDVHTRNFTFLQYTADVEVINSAAKKLLDNEINATAPSPLNLRLMGIRMANLLDESEVAHEKQIKLKDFLQLTASSKSQKLGKINAGNKFVCPICEVELTTSLINFNKHVDECLISDISEPCSSKTTPSTGIQLDLAEVPSSDYVEIGSEIVVCPVCGHKQTSNNLESLNAHIDDCLSKGAIKDMLADDMSSQVVKKRKLLHTDENKKKSKLKNGNTRTLDCYFKS